MTIKSTRDYSLFKSIKGNRDLNKSHVRRLQLIFGDRPQKLQWVPILVNENHEVIDGQHRLEAAKKLEIPVYYRVIKGLTLEDCQALNSNSKMWTPTDYARAFCENGVDSYCKYLEFKKKWYLNHDVVMRYLALDTPITVQSFKEGYLEVPSITKSNRYAKWLEECGQYVKHYKLRAIALSFLEFASQSEDYSQELMMDCLKKLPNPITAKFTQMEEATLMWKEIYYSF